MKNIKWPPRLASAAEVFGMTEEEMGTKLTNMGLTPEDLEDDTIFKFNDFREEFREKPIAAVRKAYRALRGGKSPGTSERLEQLRTLGIKAKVDDLDTAALLALYLPDKPNDPVTNALKTRFGTRPVIVFKDDGTVATDETLEYVSGVEQGFPEQEAIIVGGKLAKLWRVGVKPDVMVEEDPLFPGTPLRNGVSSTNNRNWSKVQQHARQICRIIAERGDIDVNNRDAVLRLIERATSENCDPPTALTEAYPEAYLDYNERAKLDTLPKLKVPLGSTSSKPQNPFGVRRNY